MRIRHGLSLVPEGRRLFTAMTVAENLELGGFFAVPPAKGVPRALERILRALPDSRPAAPAAHGSLSGGEQQMFAIGMCLNCHPRLLVLDEPSFGATGSRFSW